MSRKILIDANFPGETRVVLLSSNNNIEEIEYETANKHQIKGNIYLAKITRIEPSLQAAFIDYGNDKHGFLPFSEIHPDYYHIPVSDQKASMANLKAITPPEITSDDLAEKHNSYKGLSLVDDEEIDINKIAKLVEEKIEAEIAIDASETDIDIIEDKSTTAQLQDKQYKIQEVMKKGQILLVQAIKEERGNKGASFTTFISLAGKYCVLMPNKDGQNGISRRISHAEERRRLKNIISKLKANDDKSPTSVILRTAGNARTTYEIKKDYDYLARLWNKIRETTLKSKAPCFIHQEDGILQKTIRDIFDHNVKELIIQGTSAYSEALKFMQDILPAEISKVKEHKQRPPIFSKYGIEEQLSSLYQPIVPLSSGGYIVINPTEALISIDVNSGRATSEKNIEETALKTNLEAAREIARQVKLRDLSGLLVIDFIDMYETKNRKIVERSFREFLSRDRARIQTGQISTFGLLEMSRQRLRSSFLESNSTICSHCNGKGIVRADESNAMLILRTVENEIHSDKINIVNVYANLASVIYLLNNKRLEINFIEEKYGIKLNFNADPNATSDSFSIEKVKLAKNTTHSLTSQKPALQASSSTYNKEPNEETKKGSNEENAFSTAATELTKEQQESSEEVRDKDNNIDSLEAVDEKNRSKNRKRIHKKSKQASNRKNNRNPRNKTSELSTQEENNSGAKDVPNKIVN